MSTPAWILTAVLVAGIGYMIYLQNKKGSKSNGSTHGTNHGEGENDHNQGDQNN